MIFSEESNLSLGSKLKTDSSYQYEGFDTAAVMIMQHR